MKSSQRELTVRALLIGALLAIVLGGSNIYLGLKIGSTISASIPASIMSMMILKLFKNYSVKENNIAQTTASIGEALAAPSIFILPAFLITGIWKDFPYFEVFILALCGGIIGIVYSAFLRKILLSDKSLKFPEGVAIGRLLIATEGNNKDKSGFYLLIGMLISGIFGVLSMAFHLLADSMYKIVKLANGGIAGTGVGFSMALIGAGSLMGFATGLLFLVGAVLGWVILMPMFAVKYGIKDSTDLVGSAFVIWKMYIRPIGIGVMIAGGIGITIKLIKPIVAGIKESFKALDKLAHADFSKRDEADTDLSVKTLSMMFATSFIIMLVVFTPMIDQLNSFGLVINGLISFVLLVFVVFLGFILSSIAGYFAGLMGSNNTPGSSLNLISVIILSTVFIGLPMLFHDSDPKFLKLIGLILLLAAIIDYSLVPANENVQDYKSGQMVGATPYKQQIGLFVGLVTFIFVLPLFMNLIFNAYGIGGVVPRASMDPNHTLNAPQAGAIAALVTNIVDSKQDWSFVIIGLCIGAVAFVLDLIGTKTGKFKLPVAALGSGLYLPPSITVSVFIGGCIELIIRKISDKHLVNDSSEENVAAVHKRKQYGELMVAGLIAGESFFGLILAIPFVIMGSSDALAIHMPEWYESPLIWVFSIKELLTIAFIVFVFYRLIKIATNVKVK